MANTNVLYPRRLIRTSKAAAVVMIVQAVLMVTLLATLGLAGGRPWNRLALVAAAALMSIGYGRRALLQLQQLEQTHAEPDALMISLFDFSIGVPTLGLIAVIVGTTP